MDTTDYIILRNILQYFVIFVSVVFFTCGAAFFCDVGLGGSDGRCRGTAGYVVSDEDAVFPPPPFAARLVRAIV